LATWVKRGKKDGNLTKKSLVVRGARKYFQRLGCWAIYSFYSSGWGSNIAENHVQHLKHFIYLSNNSRCHFWEAEIGIWHVTAVYLPQTDTKTVHITLSIIWIAIENLLNHNILMIDKIKMLSKLKWMLGNC